MALTITEKTANYTLTTSDIGLILMNSPNDLLVKIPKNADAAIDLGITITICKKGAGDVTVTPLVGVVLRTTDTPKLRKKWSTAVLIKIDTDEWLLAGDTLDL